MLNSSLEQMFHVTIVQYVTFHVSRIVNIYTMCVCIYIYFKLYILKFTILHLQWVLKFL
jgi:hypothetical protein